jgi:hypothetical protein
MSGIRKLNLLSKKMMTIDATMLAVNVTSVILVASSISQVTTAQQQKQQRIKMNGWSAKSQIRGFVSAENVTSNLINENKNDKVVFIEATQTAKGQATNGTVIGGQLGIVQGCLVCIFLVVANTANYVGHGYGGWDKPWE